MPRSESIPYFENPERTPLSFHYLAPYEIKKIDDKFVAYLPVSGTRNAKGKNSNIIYSEISFSTEEEAYQAVAEAKKDLGIAALN